jgi:hypothetical protein
MVTSQLLPFPTMPPAPAPYLLDGLLPQGQLLFLDGPAGIGKSLLAAAWTAALSQATTRPITLLTNDSPRGQTLAHHLARHNPSYQNLKLLSWCADKLANPTFALNEALQHLENHIIQEKPILLVIDSLEDSLHVLAGETEDRLRDFWSRLTRTAQHHNCTVLILSLPPGRRGTSRIAKSAAFHARTIYSLAWHPGDATLRILTRTLDRLAPAGTQWHVGIAPDGQADWHLADEKHHTAPSQARAPITWLKQNHKMQQLPTLARAIKEELLHPIPASILKGKILGQGYSYHAFRSALKALDVKHEKQGSTWTYIPGPTLSKHNNPKRQRGTIPERSEGELPRAPATIT